MSRARPATRSRAYQHGAHLYKRPGREAWYARGGPLPRGGICLNTTDAEEAQRRLTDRLARGADVPVGTAPAEVPLPDLVDRYLEAPHGYTPSTLRTTKNRLLAFGLWCKDQRIALASEITAAVIDRWTTERSAKGARRTVNRDLRAVRVCLRWGAERGLCAPCRAIEGRKDLREPSRPQRREIPSPEEWRRVLAACESERARASLAALLCTGLRIEELRRVHVGALREQGDGYVLTIEPEAGPADEAWTTKGYRAREIPLSATAGKAVLAFLGVTVGPRGAVVQESWLLRKLAAACELVGVPRAGVHDTRRSFVTECFRGGVALPVIAVWCGHADVRTTEGYLSSYRSDRQVVAPTPDALTPAAPPAQVVSLADSRLIVGGAGGAPGAESAPTDRPRRRSKTP